ncbi:hypothetical protein GW17_00016683 [Ensete ventricosum]|nr:hypothetical protein GW17_00016683 [Ensete ventricosum]
MEDPGDGGNRGGGSRRRRRSHRCSGRVRGRKSFRLTWKQLTASVRARKDGGQIGALVCRRAKKDNGEAARAMTRRLPSGNAVRPLRVAVVRNLGATPRDRHRTKAIATFVTRTWISAAPATQFWSHTNATKPATLNFSHGHIDCCCRQSVHSSSPVGDSVAELEMGISASKLHLAVVVVVVVVQLVLPSPLTAALACKRG